MSDDVLNDIKEQAKLIGKKRFSVFYGLELTAQAELAERVITHYIESGCISTAEVLEIVPPEKLFGTDLEEYFFKKDTDAFIKKMTPYNISLIGHTVMSPFDGDIKSWEAKEAAHNLRLFMQRNNKVASLILAEIPEKILKTEEGLERDVKKILAGQNLPYPHENLKMQRTNARVWGFHRLGMS